jgi:Protein of unknown function (DUF3352)
MRPMPVRPRGLLVALLCGLALVAPACGSEDEAPEQTLAGAEMVPADVPLFVSIDTNLDSEQWQAAQALLDKFPGKERLLNELRKELAEDDVDFERDVRPVLGPELGVAWLDIDDEDTFVGLMQPKDPAKLTALLEKGKDPPVHTEIDGWTVFGETQAALDRFRRGQQGDTLSENDAYRDAVETLPEEAIVRAYFGGPQVQNAIREGLSDEGAPESLGQVAEFRSAALALTAQADGVRLEAEVLGVTESTIDTFEPELPETLPAGALLYLGYANLDGPARELLEAIEEGAPNFAEQRRQAEQAFGFSIEQDLLPLLANEGAFAIYPGRPLPTFVFAIAGDEEKAVRLMDRLGALLELGGGGAAGQEELEGVTVKRLNVEEEFTIFYAALEGVFVASNTRDGVLEANRDGPKLRSDALYQAAREGAEAEGGTVGFLYGNLQAGLPYVFDFAEDEGETVPDVARENVEPLQSFLVNAVQDGDRFELSGFLGIK